MRLAAVLHHRRMVKALTVGRQKFLLILILYTPCAKTAISCWLRPPRRLILIWSNMQIKRLSAWVRMWFPIHGADRKCPVKHPLILTFNHPGVPYVFSTGDYGYGVQYPSASPKVTAVGGTSLHINVGNTYNSESAWSGAGSGCSAYEPKPSFQHDSGCSRRTVADVSADADPNTGAYVVYNGSGYQIGGTSLAAPLVASIFALGGGVGSTLGNSLPYANLHYGVNLRDVTSGSTGSCGGSYLCTAKTGYDGPTGLGTPLGVTAFKVSAGGGFDSEFTSDASGWTPVNGAWGVSGGTYHTAGVSNSFASAVHSNTYSVLTYEVRITRTGCSTCSYGIFFNGTPSPLGSGARWNKGYAVYITNNGYWSVWRYAGGVGTALIAWTAVPISTGWNTLKVTYNTSTHFVQFYINGTRRATGSFGTYPSGKVGIAYYKDATAGTFRVDYAKMSISAPTSAVAAGDLLGPDGGLVINDAAGVMGVSDMVAP